MWSVKIWILNPRVSNVVGKVLASYNARPKVVPLTRYTKMMWFSRCSIFSKSNIFPKDLWALGA